MSKPIGQHQIEIESNSGAWSRKPLLRQIYRDFYQRILAAFNSSLEGVVLEIGSGIGNLKEHFPSAFSSDLFPNPWLDLVCDGYELPFQANRLSHLILFDVFHHLEAPVAFLAEARRALMPKGRVLIFDPYISIASWPAYGLFHHEPVAWNATINLDARFPRPRKYYAAQGNATRLFFKKQLPDWLPGWRLVQAQAFSSFAYLLSGGFSKPPMYPAKSLPFLQKIDESLNGLPGFFGGRCLVVLEKLS
jgi:SAM-dependent methyltransferase